MNEHSTPKASLDTFDGDAISRADREFLASLGDHPLVRHPLYSVPPPPRPNYEGCTTIDERTEAQKACFPAALDWMLVNYAYYTGAFMGKGGIISLVDGEIGTIASLRGFMQPYTIVEEGPRGGLKKTSVVDVWMMHPQRAQIDAVQTRPDRPRPTFTEDGLTVYNRYWPPAHPTSGGEIATFKTFFARLVPDDGGAGMVLELTRPQGAPAVGADGRGDHGGGGVRVRPRDAVRHPRAAVRRRLRRAVHVRRADGNVGRGALQRPAGQRALRRRQRSGSPRTGTSRRSGGSPTRR